MNESSSEPDPVEKLAEEFLSRLRTGERPALTEYTQKYPAWEERIRKVFPALVLMEGVRLDAKEATAAGTESILDTPERRLERLGDYRILREVGRGGMGIVYEAEQESLGRHVALKVLPAHALLEPRHLHRFQREARAAAQLHHTNIVPVYGVGEQDGLHYYVMQFIQGLGLDEVLVEVRRQRQAGQAPPGSAAAGSPVAARGLAKEVSAVEVARSLLTGEFAPRSQSGERPAAEPSLSPAVMVSRTPIPSSAVHLPGRSSGAALSESGRPYWQSVARVGIQVAEALAHAHGEGILHRDIKPSNLLVDTQGHVWVTDFGLAKAADSADLTHPGDIVGTVRYLAPERFQGKADVRSDVYALGLTLYELLTLRPAFDESDRNKLVAQVMHEEPPRPRRLNAAVPRDLETIVLKAIAREPAHRYPTAIALAEDLKRFLDDRPIQARRVSPVERLGRWCRRNPAVAGLAAAVVFALLAGTVLSSYYAAEAIQERDRADAKAMEAGANAERAAQKATEAEAHAQRADATLYAAHLNLAQVAWERGQVGRAQELLELARWPTAGQENLRGWEWHYQLRLCQGALRTFQGHNQGVNSVVFSPDGKWLASAGVDTTIKVWDAASGQELRTLQGHDRPVWSVAVSWDGKQLASASGDTTIKIWDAASGQELRTFRGHERPVVTVAFSPDGTRLASASGATIKIWDAASGQELWILKDHILGVSSVAFSPDGSRLASASQDRTVKVWEVASGQLLRTLQGHPLGVTSVAFSPDGQRLASCCWEAKLKVWDVASGRELRTYPEHASTALISVAFSPDGSRLVSASTDGTLTLWEATGDSAAQEPLTLQGHTGEVRGVAFSPDGTRLASAGSDGTMKVWELSSRAQALQVLRGHKDVVWGVAFSPDGKWLASGGLDKTVKVWDLGSGQPLRTLQGHTDRVWSVAFSPDGKRLASASWDRTIKVWDVASGQELRTLWGHASVVRGVTFSPDGQRLASTSGDMTVKVWDVASGRELLTLKGHTGPVYSVAFSPDGNRLASASVDRTVKVWDVASGQELRTLPEQGTRIGRSDSVAFSPDGTRLAANLGATVKVWEAASGRELLTLKGSTGGVRSVAFSPDGNRLAGAGGSGTVLVWDAHSGQELRTLPVHRTGVRSVAFSPDGTRLAAASGDGTVLVWDARSLTPQLRTQEEALRLVESLFARPLPKADVLARLRTDSSLREEVRREALLLAERWQEAPN